MSKIRRATKPATPAGDAPPQARTLSYEVLKTFACVFAVSYLGVGAFAMPHNTVWTPLGPLAGIIAALACRRWWLAGPLAAAGVVGGTLLGAVYSPLAVGRLWFPATYWAVAAIALLVGAAGAFALDRRPDLARWGTYLGVVCVLATVWVAGWTYATRPVDMSFAPVELFRATPVMSADTYDEQIFVLTVRRMNNGMGYYAAMGKTLAELNAARPGAADDMSRPTTFRLPTLFWFLAALPRGGLSWAVAMLVLASAGVIASWTIAERYTIAPIALVGTTLSGVYLARFSGINLPDSELWAGALALVAVALALKSLSVKNHALAWASAAAAVALLATLTRELAVAFLLVGLASTLVAGRVRSRRLWMPWVVALGVLLVAYIAHAQAVTAIARTLPTSSVAPGFRYFDPSGRGLSADVLGMARYAWWVAPVGWLVWAMGTVGGAVAPRDWPRRVLLGGVTVGGAVALFFLHPWAPPGYPIAALWGNVVLPTVVACAMLPFARVPGLGRPPRG